MSRPGEERALSRQRPDESSNRDAPDAATALGEQAIDEVSAFVGGGGDGLALVHAGAHSAVIGAKGGLARLQCSGREIQGLNGAIGTAFGGAASTLPPLIFVPGEGPGQEVKCLTVAKRLMSHPTSLMTVIAVVTSMPSMRVRSTPQILKRSAHTWNFGALRRLRRLPGSGEPACACSCAMACSTRSTIPWPGQRAVLSCEVETHETHAARHWRLNR